MMKNIFTTISLAASLLFCVSLMGNNTSAGNMTLSVEGINAACDGFSGSAIITIENGAGPYTYTLNGFIDGVVVDETILIDDLAVGVYEIEVTDASGCTAWISWLIDWSPNLLVEISCTGSNPTTVIVNAAAGVPPYSYNWSDGQTLQEIDLVGEGIYSVTVTDANGCSGVDNFIYVDGETEIVCNDLVNFSLNSFSNGDVLVTPDMLIEGPYSICETDLEFNLTDSQGTEIAPYAASQIITCDMIGLINFNMRENNSGNECGGMMSIEDLSGPVSVCINDATVVLDDNQQAVIYAIDFDGGSWDSCDSGDLRFTFSSVNPSQDPNFDSALNSSSMDISCFDVFNSAVLEIYVWDSSDNFNFCLVTVNYEHDANPCTLAGNFLEVVDGLCNVAPLDRYSIALNGTEIENMGCFYELDDPNVIPGTNVVTIFNEDDSTILNGVSTLDLIIFLRSFVNGFNSGVEAVLADFDGDLAVSTQDLILMRQVILGMDVVVNGPQYKMFPDLTVFDSDFNPFAMESSFTSYEFEDTELEDDHLVAIYKTGDLNNSAFFNNEIISGNRENGSLSFDNIDMQVGQTYEIEFELTAGESFSAATFKLLADGLQINSIDYHGYDIIENLKDNEVALSYIEYDVNSEVRFTLEVEALQNITAEDAFSISNDFLNEILFADYSQAAISLSANTISSTKDNQFESLTIYPNPTADVLNISFGADTNGQQKQIEILSIDGKVVSKFETNSDQLTIDVDQLQSTGLHIIKAQVGSRNMYSKVLIN